MLAPTLKSALTALRARWYRKGQGQSGQGMTTTVSIIDPARHSVQADLAARVAAMRMRAGSASTASLAAQVDAIRIAALANGLFPAVTVTHAIDAALARGERGALVLGWLALLRDAVAGDRHDGRACETYAAACSVRLTG